VANLNGIVYVVGGIPANGGAANLVQAYDPVEDSWQVVSPLPTRLHHVAVVAAVSKLYAIGGYTAQFQPRAGLFEYDPEADEWTEKSPVPTSLGSPAAAVIDGIIYVAGGDGGRGQRTLFAYDPINNNWTQLADMPTGRNHHAAAAIEDKLYVVGGRNFGNFTLSTFEVYDPATDTWSTLPDIPTGRSGIAAAVVRNCLFVLGGEGNDRNVNALGVFEENEYYNPLTNTWETADPMPFPRHGIGAAVVEETIHIPAGGPVEGFGVTADHDGYTPPTEINCQS